MKRIPLGHLKCKDIFYFKEHKYRVKYRVNNLVSNTCSVSCTNLATNKIVIFHIYTLVDVEE